MSEPSRVVLTLTEAAARLRIHPSTLRRMIGAGKLPAIKAGGFRILAEDVDALFRSKEPTSP